MVRFIKIALILIVFCNTAYSQYSVKWGKNIGGTGADFGKSICLSEDSSFIYISGYSNSTNGDILNNHGGFDIFLTKMNLSGDILWTKTYGGAGNDYVQKIIKLSDNNLLICGFTSSNDTLMPGNHGNYDALVMKLDTSGLVLWKKLYGGTEDEGDHSMSVVEGEDRSLVFITGAKSNDGNVIGNNGSGDFWLFKTDSLGNLLWQKCFGGTGDEDGHSILKMHDGGFIIAGHTLSNDVDVSGNHNPGVEDGWILRIDSLRNIVWQKCYGGTGIEFICNIAFADSGKIMMTGFSNSNDYDVVNSHGDFEVWVVKADTTGNIMWSKTFGGSGGDYSYDIFRNSDSEFTIGGYSNSVNGDLNDNHGGFDFWLLKTTSSGNVLWQKNFGGSLTDKEQAIYPLNENEIIMTGFSNSNDIDLNGNIGGMDCWAFKTGCLKPLASFYASSTEICAGETIVFTNTSSGAISYEWYRNSVFSGNNINNSISFLSSGHDTVKLISLFDQCSDTFNLILFVKPMPLVDLGNDTVIPSGTQFILDAGNPDSDFLWSTGETSQQISVFPPGIFSVVVNLHGCIAVDTIVLDIATDIKMNLSYNDRFEVFPIPFTDKFFICSDLNFLNEIITITDLTGKVVLRKKLTNLIEEVESDYFPNGVYFIRFSGDSNYTFKVVKL